MIALSTGQSVRKIYSNKLTEMDNSRNAVIGGHQRSRPRRRPKVSSVSARLLPDFDPKVSLLSSTNTNDQKSRNHEELDPNTMEFDALVEFLHPSFILDYLLKILQYLESDQKEMCFPNIAPYKEAFLVNLARDNRHLECVVFNEACKTIAKNISAAIEANKNVFKWIHMYESGRVARNVLVYKKVYLNAENSKISIQDQHKTCSIPSVPCARSLTSSLEELNVTDRQAIPTTFRIQTLNATLKFIKDDNRLTLEYPEMPLHQAEYIYSLICSRNDGDVGYGYKSLHSSLFQAMNVLSEQYEFEVMFVDSNRVTTRTILRKIPKATSSQKASNNVMQSRDGTSSPHQLNSSIMSTDSETSQLSKKLKNKLDIIEQVSEAYIKSSLRRILEFVEDESRASLEFKDVTYPVSRFLECALSIARSHEQHKLLKGECAPMLRNIARGCQQDSWSLRIDVGKVNKRTGTRIITYYKMPRDKMPSACNQNLPQKATSLKIVTTPGTNAGVRRVVSRERSVPEKPVNTKTDTNPANATPRRAVSRERRPLKQINGIAFQSAGAQVIDLNDEVIDTGGARERRAGTDRKRRLLEAMSTPMESDRAERMMRRMGWEGGALGARGEGITEPIMPALHLSPGAGLGHVKPVTRSTAEFRIQLLQNLLTFLKSDEKETTLSYPQPMTKREARFMGPTLNTLNQRKLIGLHRAEEMEVVKRVVEVLVYDPTLGVSCHVSGDKKELTLTKHYGQMATPKSSRKKKKKSKLDPTQQHNGTIEQTDPMDHLTFISETFELDKCCPTPKAAKSLASRIMFLEKIKGFLKTEDAEREFRFDFVLNNKHKNYIQSVITDVNKRGNCKHNSDIENQIYKEIKSAAGDCYMNVIFGGQKFFLQKKYYQRRFTNSALGLPPPVSKDVKNTIIYNNTKDSSKEEDYIDEDLSIVRAKTEIIVISDSDDEVNVKTETSKVDSDSKSDICQNSTETDCDDTAKDLDMSNESVLLDLLEDNVVSCNNGMSLDSTFEGNVKELEKAIMEADVVIFDDYVIDKDKQPTESFYEKLKDCMDNLAQVKNEFEDDSSQILDLEVNNNYNIVKDRYDSECKHDSIETEPTTATTNEDSYKDCNSTPLSKRSRSDSENSISIAKKYKLEPIVTVFITPDVTPKEIISVDLIKKVQKVISESIDDSIFLPLLECCGVRDGALVYNCHNEQSSLWLKNVLNDLRVSLEVVESYSEMKVHDVKIRINSYIDINVSKFLSRLQNYNSGLDTSEWVVTDEETHEDCVVITATVDDGSYKFICENNYLLFAGVDRAQFSVVWE